MSIPQSRLRGLSERLTKSAGTRILVEARASATSSGFLCHSHADADLALGVQAWFLEQGCHVYIDWQDASLPSTPDPKTAAAIRKRIRSADWFFYLATQNASGSVWCPWEIGYADGAKAHDKIIILPTRTGSRSYGQEYLGLYQHVFETNGDDFALFAPGSNSSGRALGKIF